jgi:PAS domain S-box-containing protein
MAGEPVTAADVLADPRLALPDWLRAHVEETGTRSAVGVPLRVRERVIGAMGLGALAGRVFTASDLALLTALADQAALALENAWLYEETQRRLQQTETLLAMSQTIGSTLDIAEVARRTTREIVRVLGADMGGAMILNESQDRLVPLAGYRLPKEAFATFASTPSVLEYPLVEEAKEVAGPIYASDSQTDPRFDHPLMGLLPHKSMLVVPMWRTNEIVGGFIIFWLRQHHQFTSDELRLADGIARQAAIALENARLLADAEARRREAEASRDFLESIARASADAIITTDVEGRITYFSPGAEDMFGYRAEEVRGRSMSEFYEGGPAQAAAVMRRLRTEDRIRTHEMRFRAKSSRWVDIDASMSLLRDPAGAVVGALGVVKDITDRKALEGQLRQSQKMEAVGRLAGGVAHDFNNLLTVIMGRSQLIMFRHRHDDVVRDQVALINTTAEQAAALTRQLLAFSRKQGVTPQRLELNTVVGTMEQMLRRLIGEDVTLGIALEPALGLVRADSGQLEQVIMNLVVNARDAMPQGGRLTIQTKNVVLDAAYTQQHLGVAAGPHVMLAIADTGVGMDGETLSHIFEPFFTTKELGQGTGLGLALVYGTVQQCGGHITVESEENVGTTFRIYFPREQGAADRPRRAGEPDSLIRGSETILLVEDEERVLQLAGEILEMAGYRVLPARNGPEALRVAAAHPGSIDLLLTDVVMPQMNGREVAERLASVRPETRMLYMSGYTFDKIVHSGVAGSDRALLHKPFTLESLTAKVREVLDGRPARPGLAG